MNLIRRLALPATAILLLACGADTLVGPGGRFTHAAATFACGPADGPAVAIYLTQTPVTSFEPSGEYVRVYTTGTLQEIAIRSPMSVTSDAAAWFHFSNGEYEIAKGGVLTVRSISADKTIIGSVDLFFPKAGRVHGDFGAPWVPNNVLCG